MLKLGAIQKQINQMLREKIKNKGEFFEKIKSAIEELKKWEKNSKELKSKIEEAKTSWLMAEIIEPLDRKIYPKERPKQISVVATDGSQIFPDHHGIASCYLLNIGIIILHYGTKERPYMESKPFLYYKDEELYEQFNGRKISVNTSIVSAKRGIMEMEFLTDALMEQRERENLVGLADGTLILWPLEGTAPDFSDKILVKFINCLDRLKENNIPLASYISRPRSNDVVNTLKVGLCPQKIVNCDRCPYEEELFLPCSPLDGVTDAGLFSHLLKEGERGPLFKSTSNIITGYKEHDIYFFYINTGKEIGRVEIPSWVREKENMLELIHSTVYDQIKKGGGYPVVLSEAHEKAVIRSNERQIFYKMISDKLVEEKIPLKMSAKKASKERVRV